MKEAIKASPGGAVHRIERVIYQAPDKDLGFKDGGKYNSRSD
jgi:hypothetical protein